MKEQKKIIMNRKIYSQLTEENKALARLSVQIHNKIIEVMLMIDQGRYDSNEILISELNKKKKKLIQNRKSILEQLGVEPIIQTMVENELGGKCNL